MIIKIKEKMWSELKSLKTYLSYVEGISWKKARCFTNLDAFIGK